MEALKIAESVRYGRKWAVALLFEPRDLWVGLYWKTHSYLHNLDEAGTAYVFYLCILPLFPIKFTWFGTPSINNEVDWSSLHD